jgi:predicted nucleotidyltransferase
MRKVKNESIRSIALDELAEIMGMKAAPRRDIPTVPDIPKQESILEEAQRLTSGDRQRDYDSPKPNHERIARLWNAYLAIRRDPAGPLSPSDVATMMILLKVVRNAHTPKRDSMVDIAGYARCLAKIEGFEEEP